MTSGDGGPGPRRAGVRGGAASLGGCRREGVRPPAQRIPAAPTCVGGDRVALHRPRDDRACPHPGPRAATPARAPIWPSPQFPCRAHLPRSSPSSFPTSRSASRWEVPDDHPGRSRGLSDLSVAMPGLAPGWRRVESPVPAVPGYATTGRCWSSHPDARLGVVSVLIDDTIHTHTGLTRLQDTLHSSFLTPEHARETCRPGAGALPGHWWRSVRGSTVLLRVDGIVEPARGDRSVSSRVTASLRVLS